MGQKSISVLNKVGYSMFWNGMWDDKLHYSKVLQKNLVLVDLFESILNNNSSLNFFKKNKLFFKVTKNLKKYKIFFKKKLNFLYKKFSFYIYFSKIWFFKLNNWIIIFFFFYSNKKKTFLTKKNSYQEIKINFFNNNFFNIFYKNKF